MTNSMQPSHHILDHFLTHRRYHLWFHVTQIHNTFGIYMYFPTPTFVPVSQESIDGELVFNH